MTNTPGESIMEDARKPKEEPQAQNIPTDEPEVSTPVERPNTTGTGGLAITINGIWAGKAGEPNPKTEITIPITTEKLFYRIESSGKGYGVVNNVVRVYINSKMVAICHGQIKEGDNTDTEFFAIPSKFRIAGETAEVQISVFVYAAQESQRIEMFKNESPFTVKFT